MAQENEKIGKPKGDTTRSNSQPAERADSLNMADVITNYAALLGALRSLPPPAEGRVRVFSRAEPGVSDHDADGLTNGLWERLHLAALREVAQHHRQSH
jgi:hypothetical protein